jgi:hypothetical protein
MTVARILLQGRSFILTLEGMLRPTLPGRRG